jgi:anti-anti-sigma factor
MTSEFVNEGPARIAFQSRGSCTIITLMGEIDLSNAARVEERILDGRNGALSYVLEMSALEYLDSAGLAMIDRLHREISGMGHTLRLVAPAGSIVHSVLGFAQLSGLSIEESFDAPGEGAGL